MNLRLISLLCFTLLATSACNNGPTLNSDGTTNPDAKSLLPADPALADIYLRSCKVCHSRRLSGAPKTGNKDEWQPRIAKGMDVLVKNTIVGFNGMPPRGACVGCNPTQFEELIRFMAVWPKANSNANAANAAIPSAQSNGE